jgi:ABC-2 type transport system permease protein
MNVFDKIFLRLFLSATPLYRRLNVNTDHLNAILTAKLTIDNRRPSAFEQMQRRQEKKELKNATLGTMLSSLLIGAILLISFGGSNDLTTSLTVYFSMFIFILAATLISDFTSVLIDIKDNMIILPKPVNDPTFVTYRLLHITIHICKILVPMLMPAIILLCFEKEIMVIVPFTLMAFMTTLLVIFLINAIYILILKITSPEKFKSIISYIQIGFTIAIFGGYQLLPRLIENSEGSNLQLSHLKYISFYPPFWFADACQGFSTLSFGNMQLLSLALSITVPVLSILLVVRYLAPSFTRKLSLINSSSAEIQKADPEKTRSNIRKSSWIEYLAEKISSGEKELTGFLFTWKMMGRSREFKMKVYPSFGYVLVIFLLIILDGKNDSLSEIIGLTSKGKMFLILLIYLSSMIPITALAQISYSDKFKASWIFNTSPIDLPGPVITGGLKSVFSGFVFPVFILFALSGIPAVGFKIIPHLLLGFINVVAVCSALAYFFLRKIPFSQPPSATGGMNFINSMLTLFLSFLFGIIHLRFFDKSFALMICGLISIIIIWFSFSLIRKTQWKNL